MTDRKSPEGANLLVRRDGLLCTVCGELEPIHPGDGTPLPAMLHAFKSATRRHPQAKHGRHTPRP